MTHPGIADPGANPTLTAALHEALRNASVENVGIIHSMIRTSREVILSEEPDGTHLIIIGFSIDANTGCLSLAKTFDVFGFDDDDDLKRVLALAVSEDVPIYPENRASVPRLAALYESLFAKGFTAEVHGVKRVLKLTVQAAHGASLGEIDDSTVIQPVDYYLKQAANEAQLVRLVEAERVVLALRVAIEELRHELDKNVRDENALQRILTDRPGLLGLEYRQVIPKHSLGNEYELDYAAVTMNGFIHLIEIEPSNLPLFTKSGNPRAELTHAEQQVLDWLDWVDTHREYAASRLPTLLRPTGTVIMGRRTDLTPADAHRLERRNAGWGGTLRILTYDDLVQQGEATLRLLTEGFMGDAAPNRPGHNGLGAKGRRR